MTVLGKEAEGEGGEDESEAGWPENRRLLERPGRMRIVGGIDDKRTRTITT